MPTSLSSLTLSTDQFEHSALSAETLAFNDKLRQITRNTTKWYILGAPEARRQRREGNSSLPAPTLLPSATTIAVPSRDAGRSVPCRVLKPQREDLATRPPCGVYMHIHGGGWVLSDETYQDPRLQSMADDHDIVCVSVGYRKAPEDPFPAGPHDCYDVAEWLIDNAESTFGAKLAIIGGESAGGHLSALTIIHLLQHDSSAKYRDFRFRAALLHFGCYSLSWLPSAHVMGASEDFMVLNLDLMNRFREAFLPGRTEGDLRDPAISPLYVDLESLRGKLPRALFTCGTEDCLIDDTLLMSARWLAAGARAELVIVPGAAHGYIAFPRGVPGSGAEKGCAAVDAFLAEELKDVGKN